MKIKLLLCVLVFGWSMGAQEAEVENEVPQDNVWEIKGNALYLILGAVELTAERSLNSESALGLTVFLPYDSELREEIQYYISPYYRLYFGNKFTSGFFLEGFAMLNSSDRDYFFDDETNDFVTDLALGIGLGGKWITKSGFIGEISFGIGRNLFNSAETDMDFVGKGGITVGYRF